MDATLNCRGLSATPLNSPLARQRAVLIVAAAATIYIVSACFTRFHS